MVFKYKEQKYFEFKNRKLKSICILYLSTFSKVFYKSLILIRYGNWSKKGDDRWIWMNLVCKQKTGEVNNCTDNIYNH